MYEQYFYLILPAYTLASLISPELNLALFLFSGRLNFEPRFEILEPISLNHINLVLLFWHTWRVSKIYHLDIRRFLQFYNPYSLFIIYLSINTLLLTELPYYSLVKLNSLFLVGISGGFLLYIQFKARGETALRNFLISIGVLVAAFSGMALLTIIFGSPDQRLAVFRSGPISLADSPVWPSFCLQVFIKVRIERGLKI